MGSGFVVPATIIAIFLSHFTSSKIVIGLLFTVPVIGNAAAPIFSNYYTGRRAHKKRMLVNLHLIYLACWLCLAVFAFFSARFSPQNAISLFFIIYGLSNFVIGIIIAPYLDYIGKVLPKKRGIFFGIAFSSSAGLAIVGALLASRVLNSFSFPANYGLCFLLSFSIQLLSIIFFAFNVEDNYSADSLPAETKPRFTEYLHSLIKILKDDKRYFHLLIVQIIISFGAMSSSFYALYASSKLELTGSILGQLTVMLILGQMIASIFLGIFGDMWGHRFSLGIAILCAVSSAILAIAGNSISQFYALFFLLGFSSTPVFIASTNLILEMATMGDGSTYLALNSTLVAPFAAIAPLLGGILIRSFSYTFVFGLTAVILITGFLTLVFFSKKEIQ